MKTLLVRVPLLAMLLVSLFAAACSADDTPLLELDAATGGSADASAGPDAADSNSTASPERAFGEFCLADSDCESKVCYLQLCSARCDAAIPNDCRAHQAFCAPVGAGTFACVGNIDTGTDVGDDAILEVGESVVAKLSPTGDADLFQVTLPAGSFSAIAQPGSDGDVRVDVYDGTTKSVAVSDVGGVGSAERAEFVVEHGPAAYFVVVTSVGVSPSNDTVSVVPAL